MIWKQLITNLIIRKISFYQTIKKIIISINLQRSKEKKDKGIDKQRQKN